MANRCYRCNAFLSEYEDTSDCKRCEKSDRKKEKEKEIKKEKEYLLRKQKIEELPDDTMFYWQSYGYVGNCLQLWAKGRSGYTTNIDNAHLFTKQETLGQLSCKRDQDIFWPVEHLTERASLVVDYQNLEQTQRY